MRQRRFWEGKGGLEQIEAGRVEQVGWGSVEPGALRGLYKGRGRIDRSLASLGLYAALAEAVKLVLELALGLAVMLVVLLAVMVAVMLALVLALVLELAAELAVKLVAVSADFVGMLIELLVLLPAVIVLFHELR